MITPSVFAYQIPNTTIKNNLEDVRLTEMYNSDKLCNIRGVYPGMIWYKNQSIQVTGSCPDNEYVKIEFTTISPTQFNTAGFGIDQSKASVWASYKGIYKTELVREDNIYLVLGEE